MRISASFQPPNTIVLHLYGRYCNANKFAGEVDLFEAMDDVKKHYAIDENRLLGAGIQHGRRVGMALRNALRNLGGSGSRQRDLRRRASLRMSTSRVPSQHGIEEKLWHLYDATDYAANLYQVPVVAYNGDKDPQREAADIMERYMAEEGAPLTRLGAGYGASLSSRFQDCHQPVDRR